MIVHLPWSAESVRAACGAYRPVHTTYEYDDVTCQRCRKSLKFKERLIEPPPLVYLNPPTESPAQEKAVRQEMNYTRRETLAYLVEGDVESAVLRMQTGFNRQVRLSGLERALREGA